jgi:hypothetical protein
MLLDGLGHEDVVDRSFAGTRTTTVPSRSASG